jgi:hypothetical protein
MPPPQPLRGANIGCADILPRARERGFSSSGVPRSGMMAAVGMTWESIGHHDQHGRYENRDLPDVDQDVSSRSRAISLGSMTAWSATISGTPSGSLAQNSSNSGGSLPSDGSGS